MVIHRHKVQADKRVDIKATAADTDREVAVEIHMEPVDAAVTENVIGARCQPEMAGKAVLEENAGDSAVVGGVESAGKTEGFLTALSG